MDRVNDLRRSGVNLPGRDVLCDYQRQRQHRHWFRRESLVNHQQCRVQSRRQ